MKLHFKEDPGTWRNQALMSALGFAILDSVLLWRRVLPVKVWCTVLVILGIIALCTLLKPPWFRGYYRLAVRIGFALSQVIGRVTLLLFFIFILTPVGLILRLAGKDALQLKRPRNVKTYWHQAKDCTPLDRLF